MTSTSLQTLDDAQSAPVFITTRGIAWVGVIATLFVILFWDFIFRMGRIATSSFGADWSHIIAIPLFSAYFIYLSRFKLAAATRKTFWPGLILFYLGVAGYAFGIYPGRNDMAQGYSMIMCLFGLVLFTLGPSMMKVLWFPIGYLFFGVKISQAIWDRIAWQLQNIAAKSSVFILDFMGYYVEGKGTTIYLTFTRAGISVTEKVNVEEACSGLRMLMAFVALGVAIAFLSDRKWWQRLVLLLATVPVAVGVNVARVTTISILHMIDKDYAVGDFHIFIGMLMLIPAGLVFLLIGWILDKIVIEDNPDTDAKKTRAGEEKVLLVGDAKPGDAQPGATGKAFALGSLLTLGIGGLTASTLFLINPQMFVDSSSRLIPAILVILALIILIAAIFGVRKTIAKCRQLPAIAKPATLGVALGIMLFSVLGLKGVVSATQLVLHKQQVPLRQELYKISDNVSIYEKAYDERPLTEELRQAVGTDKYLQRVYRNTQLPDRSPGSIVRLNIFYYTGTADTVPHVPDRCYIAGGLKPAEDGIEQFDIKIAGVRYREKNKQWWADTKINPKGARIPAKNIPATIFTYQTEEEINRPSFIGNVIYFFAANGKFLPTPNHVRFSAFDPTDKYSYYCKIEILPDGVSDPQQAQIIVSQFMSALLPDIMACLPDWNDVRDGHWPIKSENQQ